MPKAKVERNREIMQMIASGCTRRTIAEKFGISIPTVNEIVLRERAKAPIDKPSTISDQVENLDYMIEQAMILANGRGAPVTAGKDGDIVYDPEDHSVVRDHGGRVSAMNLVRALQERKARLLGLDSAQRAEVSGSVTYIIEGLQDGDV